MNRSRDYYRKQRAKHIKRKKRKMNEWYSNGNCLYLTKPDGSLSKGKIHCSCPACSIKSSNYKKAKDLARIEAMDESENYYYDERGYRWEEEEQYILNDDLLYFLLKADENWYYEEDFYYDWLEEQENS